MRISEKEADFLLMAEVAKVEAALDSLVTYSISDSQLAALVSLTYNIGIGAFARSTLLRKLNAGDVRGAADEFLRWSYAAGIPVRGLKRRREQERTIFLLER